MTDAAGSIRFDKIAEVRFLHILESRDPGASGKIPRMWPLDSGFRRNDGGGGGEGGLR
jgi:hypothetical protein